MGDRLARRASRAGFSASVVAAASLASLLGAPCVSAATRSYPQLRGAVLHTFLGETVAVNAREFASLAAMHATVTRLDLPLELLEPHVDGAVDISAVHRIDVALDQAARDHVMVIGTISGMPCWLSSAPVSPSTDCQRADVATTDNVYRLYPPDDYQRWAAVMRFVAREWGARMWAIEIGNEPNNPNFFAGTAADYAHMLRVAYDTIKQVCPHTLVVGASLAEADTGYLTQLFHDGIQGHFDALSVHPYDIGTTTGIGPFRWLSPERSATADPSEDSLIAGVPAIRRMMIAYHDVAKPILITEYGYPVCSPDSMHLECVTANEQSDWLADAVRQVAHWPYVKAFLVYQLRDIENTPIGAANSPLGNFGLLTDTFAPRPSWFALRSLFGSLPAP
jgi:hypothetical protein